MLQLGTRLMEREETDARMPFSDTLLVDWVRRRFAAIKWHAKRKPITLRTNSPPWKRRSFPDKRAKLQANGNRRAVYKGYVLNGE